MMTWLNTSAGREYGNPGDYNSDFPGLNVRLPELNALLGLHSLGMLEENAKRRNCGRQSSVSVSAKFLASLFNVFTHRIARHTKTSPFWWTKQSLA